MKYIELFGRKIKELSEILKDEPISDLEIKEESDLYGIDRLKISFKIDDSDTFTLYIRLSNFVGANGIEFLSEEEIVREFEEKYSYLKGYLLGETIKERKINGYSNEIKSHIRVAKKMHEIYRVYFEKVRIKEFTTAYETVEFYLKQMEKQIRKMCEAYQENKNIENFLDNLEVLVRLTADEMGAYCLRLSTCGRKNYDCADNVIRDCLKGIKKCVEEIRKRI